MGNNLNTILVENCEALGMQLEECVMNYKYYANPEFSLPALGLDTSDVAFFGYSGGAYMAH